MGLAIAISRANPAPIVGHIGWAVELADGTFLAGATEAYSALQHGGFIPPGQNNNAWTMVYNTKDAALAAFAGNDPDNHPRYNWWKCYNVAKPNFEAARQQGIKNKQLGYTFLYNNCLDHTGLVLEAYGVPWQNMFGQPPDGMPWKQTNPAPIGWLNAWKLPLHTLGGAEALDLQAHLATIQTELEKQSKEMATHRKEEKHL